MTYVVGYRAEPARHGPVAVVESSITSFQRWYEACDTELDLAVKRLLVYGEKYGINPDLKPALEAMI
ncbi:MAG: hypothetical protein PHU06_06265 [Gallionella sp.]|nr:hypothetical protein [Gallionella sp.]MDD4958430.1 hypothetical protein [Gallionella sp.]